MNPAESTLAEETDLPPRIPPELPEMDRLLTLLGNVANGVRLSHKRQEEVRALAAGFPTGAEQASAWRRALRELRTEMLAEADPEADVRDEA